MKIRNVVSLAALFCSALISTAAVPREDLDLSLVPPVVNTRPGPEYQDEARPGAMIIGMDRTPKGRIWACWTGTGDNAEAYFILATSDDDGATWSKPRVVIDPKDTPGKPPVKSFVGNLWTDPTGRLWLFFDQGLGMFDGRAGDWFITCDNPDAADPVWSQPVRFADGCTLNKPTVLKNGEWLLPVSLWHRQHINPPLFKEEYHELDSQRMAHVYVSTNHGKAWTRRGGVVIPETSFDEHMIVELRDGRLWMLARTKYGMAETFSTDSGRTWSAPQPSTLKNVSARFFIRRLASGRLLLVKNGPTDQRLPSRSHMSAFLSDDDGKTWSGGLLLDERTGVSYPDGFQSPDGLIHILYDHNRHTDAEIFLAKFREADVLAGKFISPDAKPQILANKALGVKKPAQQIAKPLADEPAEVEVLGAYEADTFQMGVKLFLDRAYTLNAAPGWLLGQNFLRGSIERLNFRCTKAGVVTLVTCSPAATLPASVAGTLEERGFLRVEAGKGFQLFGALGVDQGRVYQKQVERGEEFRLGKYAFLVGVKKTVEVLPNGIQLPAVWPPRDGDVNSAEPMAVPYLQNPPKVIPINVGRQLFVDDFLIEQTDLTRALHQARKHPANPVFKPETPQELAPNTWAEAGQAACHLSHGGVFFDPRDGVFKMFYMAGWRGALALATSKDLLHWERPELGIAGGNTLLPPGQHWAGGDNSVWLDLNAKCPDERLKFMVERRPDFINTLHTSAEGRIWSRGLVTTGKTDDYPSFFYNPFREVWVSSIKLGGPRGRCRYYSENRDFLAGADISREVYWCNADRLDAPDPAVGDPPQLYGMNAVAYESLLLGVFQIHLGPKNEVCAKGQFPKTIDLKVGFSRDGFHWDRPDRRAFIAATRQDGDWDRAYLHGPTGVCLVVGDELWFPYSGFSGLAPNGKRGDYVGGSIGMAVLRRDGFASMDAGEKPGTLTTRPVTFNGKQLFVNADCPRGELRVEILDEKNQVIAPFSAANCEPIAADKTKQVVRWKNGGDLSAVAGKLVKFRFHLTNGKLYAFWVSPDDSGASGGYVAAGGPEFNGVRDIVERKQAAK